MVDGVCCVLQAAKSVRESPTPIKSKAEAQKLSGIGRCVGDIICLNNDGTIL